LLLPVSLQSLFALLLPVCRPVVAPSPTGVGCPFQVPSKFFKTCGRLLLVCLLSWWCGGGRVVVSCVPAGRWHAVLVPGLAVAMALMLDLLPWQT
jgi:hypothetical protein